MKGINIEKNNFETELYIYDACFFNRFFTKSFFMHAGIPGTHDIG